MWLVGRIIMRLLRRRCVEIRDEMMMMVMVMMRYDEI